MTFDRCWAIAALLAVFAQNAFAQAYPTHSIRLVVPFPAGGTTDILARAAAQKLSESLGQAVVVDNRPGAAGNIGADLVAKSAPDGYTLLMGTVGTHAINPSLYAKMPYDHVKDFVPVVLVAGVPNVLAVYPAFPVNSVAELIALAKSKPGTINFASSGSGTSIHMSGELFKAMAGVDMTHIPYKGSSPALTDLLGGQIDLMFTTVASVAQYIKSERLRALAVTSASRSAAYPNLPTVAEAGVPGYAAESWYGIYVPAGTPTPIIARLNQAVHAAVKSESFKSRIEEEGLIVANGPPEELSHYVHAEEARWKRVVSEAKIKAD